MLYLTKSKRMFIKRSIGFLFSVFLLLSGRGQGIGFEKTLSWDQVKVKANASGKYIFVDCFATWCGPCKGMDEYIYSNDTVGSYINKKFISIKVQMDSTKSDNEEVRNWYNDAHVMMQQYNVNVFPTFLFFSPQGKIVHKAVGYKDKDAFIKLASESTDSNIQYYTLQNNFKNNQLDLEFYPALARQAKYFKENDFATEVAYKYIKGLDAARIFEKENLQFIKEFTRSVDAPGFLILYQNISKVNEVLGKDEAEASLTFAIDHDEIKPYIKKVSTPDWHAIHKNVVKYKKLGEETFLQSQVLYSINNEDWELFGKVASQWFHKYGQKRKWISANLLNNLVWKAFEKGTSKKALEGALVLSASTIHMNANSSEGAGMLDTYANILYKLGRVKEAIAFEERALVIANRDKNEKVISAAIKSNLMKMMKGDKTWP